MSRSFRPLDPVADRQVVTDCLADAADYYRLWLGRPPGPAEVEAVFTDAPPGCDPAQSQRLGLFLDGRLCGVAELSFGFPEPDDAYLGLMILSAGARGAGHGAAFHDQVLQLARARGCPRICLGVLDANDAGRAFWRRVGYAGTAVTRQDAETGHRLQRMVRRV